MAALLISGFGTLWGWLAQRGGPRKTLRALLNRYSTDEAKLSLMGLGPHV